MNSVLTDIVHIIETARTGAYQVVNTAMVEAYWLVGKRIVEEEQQDAERAKYGAEIIKTLSKELSKGFGRGFSETNIRNFRLFYLTFSSFPPIQQTLSAKLSWSHYQAIIRANNVEARNYYLQEASRHNWSVRTLERNIHTLYYQRLISSQQQHVVKDEMLDNTSTLQLYKI